jgi:DNA-binding MarR family transcriptional regulator
MAAVTSVMRVQQLLLARVEDILKPYGITFAAYEALRLLAFTRAGALPMGKVGVRLMVHPAAVTNAIGKLEQRGLVRRSMSRDDRRVVIATITDAGRSLVEEATAALNDAAFGLPGLTAEQAAELVRLLRGVRALTGDLGMGDLGTGDLGPGDLGTGDLSTGTPSTGGSGRGGPSTSAPGTGDQPADGAVRRSAEPGDRRVHLIQGRARGDGPARGDGRPRPADGDRARERARRAAVEDGE